MNTIEILVRHYEALMRLMGFFAQYIKAIRPDVATIDSFWDKILKGPGSNWNGFRNHLLNIHNQPFAFEKFVGPDSHSQPSMFGEYSFMQTRLFASRIACWTKSSRRIYRVPLDLELLFMATSLEEVDWGMVKWPFESFVIELEEPVILFGSRCSAILVSRDLDDPNTGGLLAFQVIPEEISHSGIWLSGDHEMLSRSLKRKDWGKFSKGFQKIYRRLSSPGGAGETMYVRNDCFDESGIAKQIEEFEDDNKIILRIIFGLVLYLQTRGNSEGLLSEWTRSSSDKAKSHPGKLIRIEAEVCDVRNTHKLKDHERAALRPLLEGKDSLREISTHHREGHWRRPPGKGDDPNYPKTVWVRPTIVRIDKLEEGTLPAGSIEEL